MPNLTLLPGSDRVVNDPEYIRRVAATSVLITAWDDDH
jgi:hypothetical protein